MIATRRFDRPSRARKGRNAGAVRLSISETVNVAPCTRSGDRTVEFYVVPLVAR